jgi:hypothetical protein
MGCLLLTISDVSVPIYSVFRGASLTHDTLVTRTLMPKRLYSSNIGLFSGIFLLIEGAHQSYISSRGRPVFEYMLVCGCKTKFMSFRIFLMCHRLNGDCVGRFTCTVESVLIYFGM